MKFFQLIYFIFFVSLVYAQEHYAFSQIDSNNGLSENQVHSITQLPDGRIVIMTDGLINFYNGTTFQYLHIDNKNVYPLTGYHGYHHPYIDTEGNLWIKNYQQLLLFDLKKECFVSNMDSILHQHSINDQLSDFFIDPDSNYWYLTINDDLIGRDTKKKEHILLISDVSRITGEKDDKLLDLNVYGNLVFLFYKSGYIICFNSDTDKEIYRVNPLEGEKKEDYNQIIITYRDNHHIYLIYNGYGGILFRYDIKKREWKKILQQNYWFNTLSSDINGNIWLSCREGFWFIDKNLTSPKHISGIRLINGKTFNSSINSLFCDKQGGIWLGTPKNGIFYYHPDRFKFRNIGHSSFDTNDNLEFRVNCFIEKDNEILVGTSSRLFRYNPDSLIITRLEEFSQDFLCYVMMKDSKDRIWVCGGTNGLYSIVDNRIKHYTFLLNNVFYIYENPDSSLFLSLGGKGFGTFDPETGNYEIIEVTEKLGVIYEMSEYNDDSVIGLSDTGIFIYDRKQKKLDITGTYEKERPEIFRQNNFRYDCLYTDSRKLIWLGTRDGLSVWNPKENKLLQFHSEDGLINNRIKSIIEDNLNNIWVSTSGGISRININNTQDGYQFSFSNFNQYDGVLTKEFFERSVYKTDSGRLFWGGINGFNEIIPKKTEKHQSLLKPLFYKLSIAGIEIKQGVKYNGNLILDQSVTSAKQLNLKYNQNFITFEFSALNYINPTQTFYRFKLEGIDDTFMETIAPDGIGKANYTNLPPGNYTLKVYSGNNDKEWSDEYAEMKIIIHPPFWKTTLAYILYVIIFIIIFYLFIFYLLKRNKEKILKQQKEELDRLKYQFYTNVSHELRTPLTLIITPLESLLKKTEEITLKAHLTEMHKNAGELLRLINQLLDFRKLEITGESLKTSYCNINEFLESICSSFRQLIQNKNIDFNYEFHVTDLYMHIDKDKFQKIINNLLSNAYKFTPHNGQITLSLDKIYLPENQIEMVLIKVKDTGCGISEKDLPHIFSRFYQVSDNNHLNTGNGIGLHLAQEYARLHKGFILVESILNKGSLFTVNIPFNLPDNDEHRNEYRSTSENNINNKLKLLIVEDNDKFRSFLKSELTDNYTITESVNGTDALDKIKHDQPDLIISDIMMPEMDGIELCRQLKSNIRTSHIPLILLSARSSEEIQIEGFESGADDYISKPFNMDILRLRISKLIEQQQQRKELFKKAIFIQPENVTITNIDRNLIEKAIECIENNLNNPLYSVNQLSTDMHMDRTGLYRKLVAITGQPPTQFIRSIRLKKAAQLLSQGLNVSEVADKVGFNSIGYFSKCFQEEFGVKPSQYNNFCNFAHTIKTDIQYGSNSKSDTFGRKNRI